MVHRFRDSEFSQDISLIAGVPRVDVEFSTDWHERATFLKAGFPVNVSSTKVAAEIPYGAIEREQAGNEMVMGKWVDISDADYGVAILNNGRNGFDAKDNVIRLSVIRGPWGPDPRADEGHHSFGYSIYTLTGADGERAKWSSRPWLSTRPCWRCKSRPTRAPRNSGQARQAVCRIRTRS